VDERNRRQSYSPNARDFDREYNAQGSSGSRTPPNRDRFENEYSDNADRWTGYDEGRQHWRGQEGYGSEDYEQNRREFGRGQDYGAAEGRGYSQYRKEDWGPSGVGHDARGPFQRDREREAGARREWGGRSYGTGVSDYGVVGPYSSPGFAGGHPGMPSLGNYGGGIQSYSGRGRYAGRGPKGYRRSDDRIREEVNDRLTDHSDIDPSEVEVRVEQGVVTLTGTVEDRHSKRLAEDIAEGVAGVVDVNNQIRVAKHGEKPKDEVDDQQITRLGINAGDRKLKNTESK
jgi:hypothetical protein